jgi:hypothetical protein
MKKRTTKKKLKKLTPDQLQAIRDYAVKYGQSWRRVLERDWIRGDYDVSAAEAVLLQQIRDQFGPAWLAQYQFPAYMEID